MILRPYQHSLRERVRDALRTTPRVLMSLPTGGGKTVIAASMLEAAAAKGHRCLFLAHRRELIHQASARLGVPHGLILAGEPATDAPVQVASVQTIVRRDCGRFDFVFVDEAHHTAADSYQRILERVTPRWVVGLTATPYRTDGRGLGDTYGALVAGPSTLELTEQGYLCPVEIFAPPCTAMRGAKKFAGDYRQPDMDERMNTPKLVGDIVATWRKHAPGRTVAFGVSVAHARAIADAFRAAHIPAETVTGELDTARRAEYLDDLAAGRIQVVTTCGVLTEGWDCPAASCAIIARPTLSRGLWRQMAGRILRTHDGKTSAIILDHAGNAERHGHLYAPDPATLEQTAVRQSTTKVPPGPTTCRYCFCVFWRADTDGVCPGCGAAIPVTTREVETVAGDLVKFEHDPRCAHHDDRRAMAMARDLAETARLKNYKRGWIFWKLASLYGRSRANLLMKEAA